MKDSDDDLNDESAINDKNEGLSVGNDADSEDSIADEILDGLKGQSGPEAGESRDLTDEEVLRLRDRFREGMAKMKDHPWNDKTDEE